MRNIAAFGSKLTEEAKIAAAIEKAEMARSRVHGQFPVARTQDHIQREYNLDTYGSLLNTGLTDPESLFNLQASPLLQLPKIIVSQRDEFYSLLPQDGFDSYKSLVWHTVLQYVHLFPDVPRPTNFKVCELGCGWGYLIGSLFDGIGGELTENGVALGRRLGYKVQKFDFYEKADYEMIPDKSVVYTSHAIEQLPSAEAVIEGLKSVRDRIACVIHFEPSYLPSRTDKLGQIRNQYILDHSYNRDLFQLLEQDPEIQIMESIWDVIGVNPINPTNLCVWKFK